MSERLRTCVAVLTPPGRGAVAVVAIRGPQAEQMVDRHFLAANKRTLDNQQIGRIHFGRWATPDGEEIVVLRRASADVEVHCHGGIAASAAIVETLLASGCDAVSHDDFLRRHSADSFSAAALSALPHAKTERTTAILLDQYRGAFRLEIAKIERLSQSAAETDRTEALQRVDRLLARQNLGRKLTTPWQVAIGGKPNVGKSSLINALLGFDRALVYEAPGTTRDVVTAVTAFEGWPIEFADTAGLRRTADTVEAAGIARAEAQIDAADLTLLVFDLTRPWTPDDMELIATHPRSLVIHNKVDLANPQDGRPAGLRVSALTGCGIIEIGRAIVSQLIPDPPAPGEAVPLADEQVATLNALKKTLQFRPNCARD